MGDQKRTDPERTLELLWGTGRPPDRGPRPRHTLEGIVDAAIAVADTDGLENLAMRRVAERLGTGTMSLYTYVPGRAELLHLMLDRVTSTLPPLPGDAPWRPTLDQYARDARDLATRHPWTTTASAPGLLLLGPHTTARADALHGVLRRTGLDPRESARIAAAVDAYVRGHCRTLADQQTATRRSGVGYDQWWEQATPHLTRLVTPERFPHLHHLWEHGAFDEPADTAFEYGLQRLLDGIGHHLATDPPEAGHPRPAADIPARDRRAAPTRRRHDEGRSPGDRPSIGTARGGRHPDSGQVGRRSPGGVPAVPTGLTDRKAAAAESAEKAAEKALERAEVHVRLLSVRVEGTRAWTGRARGSRTGAPRPPGRANGSTRRQPHRRTGDRGARRPGPPGRTRTAAPGRPETGQRSVSSPRPRVRRVWSAIWRWPTAFGWAGSSSHGIGSTPSGNLARQCASWSTSRAPVSWAISRTASQ